MERPPPPPPPRASCRTEAGRADGVAGKMSFRRTRKNVSDEKRPCRGRRTPGTGAQRRPGGAAGVERRGHLRGRGMAMSEDEIAGIHREVADLQKGSRRDGAARRTEESARSEF